MTQTPEILLVKVIDLFAQRFNKHAVLRGGMVLRVLGCERMTNDLDYVFIPFKSKKDIVARILSVLQEMDGAQVRYSLNSKCLRIVLTVGDNAVQIEAKTAMRMPVSILSTKNLSAVYDMPPRLIQVVDYPVALADKMAAWNERRLIRDAYDIWFYLKMGIRPDQSILKKRLDNPEYSKLVKNADYFCGRTVLEFYVFLNEKIQALSDVQIEEELGDYLSPSDIAGLSMRFRAEMAKLL